MLPYYQSNLPSVCYYSVLLKFFEEKALTGPLWPNLLHQTVSHQALQYSLASKANLAANNMFMDLLAHEKEKKKLLGGEGRTRKSETDLTGWRVMADDTRLQGATFCARFLRAAVAQASASGIEGPTSAAPCERCPLPATVHRQKKREVAKMIKERIKPQMVLRLIVFSHLQVKKSRRPAVK